MTDDEIDKYMPKAVSVLEFMGDALVYAHEDVLAAIRAVLKDRDHYKALLKSCEEMKEDFRRHIPYNHGR